MKITITASAKAVLNLLARVSTFASRREPIHRKIGVRVMQWVDRNFRSDGALAGGWKPLAASTIYGRRKRSSKPLQDSGRLLKSFHASPTAQEVRVGTPTAYAPFHEFGTKPFTIRPRAGGVLAWPSPGGRVSAVRFTLRGAEGRGTAISRLKFAHAQVVHHPGLPARRMLPTVEQAERLAVETIQQAIQKELGSR